MWTISPTIEAVGVQQMVFGMGKIGKFPLYDELGRARARGEGLLDETIGRKTD